MVIDTTSREGMENSLAHLMGVSVPELYQYIEAAADSAKEDQWCINQDLFDKAMNDFYCDMIEQELPDEILFFHLSRHDGVATRISQYYGAKRGKLRL